MTATFGRALAFALAGLVLLLFALWLASPLWLPPLAHTFLADNDVELLALDSGWIRPDGVDVAALEVRAPGLSLRAEGLRLAWSATTGLRVLTVDHVAAGWTAPDPQAPAAPPTDALPVPPAPRELFAALPVERIELRALSAVAAFADGRRLGTEGSATIDATGMRYAGEATLPGGSTTSLQASLTPAGALELRLGSDRGGPMVSAEGHVGGRAGATTVRGTVVVRAGTLPALLPSTPDVAGTLLLEGVVGAQDAELTIRPGTDLTLAARPPDASGPELTVTWTPRERWSIALADGRLDSTGHADLLFEARHEELEATGAVSLREIAGPEDALDFTVDAQATVAEGPRSAAVRTTLRGALHDLATLTLRAGEVLRVARLEDPVAAVALEDVVVSLRDPATIALDAPAANGIHLSVHVAALELGEHRMDLAGLDLAVELNGAPAAAEARIKATAPGVDITARATTGGALPSPRIELEQTRLGLAGTELPARMLAAAPELPLSLRGGELRLGPARWPLEPGDRLDLAAAALALSFDGLAVDGIDGHLAVEFTEQGARFALSDAGFTRATAGETTLAAGRLALEGRVPVLDPAAGPPDRIFVDALRAGLDRLEAGTLVVDAIDVEGTGSLAAAGDRTASLTLAAGSLDVGVPAADLNCALDLTGDELAIHDCRVDVLGGRIEAPAGRVNVVTRSGYVPVAVEGVDLGSVLLLMQDDALAGDGILDGALPVRLVDGVPTVRDGYVGARPPGGQLRYGADAALLERLSQPGLSLAMTALGDFRYETLGSFVDYETDGTLALRVRLAGASPGVEGGRPINFNLNVTQNLPLLLQSLRLSQNIGETLERRLRERNLQ